MSMEIRCADGRLIPLERAEVVFGSGPRAKVQLAELEERHAVLKPVSGRWFLQAEPDCALWVNDQAVNSAFLKPGDRFRFSGEGAELRLCDAASEPPPLPPPRRGDQAYTPPTPRLPAGQLKPLRADAATLSPNLKMTANIVAALIPNLLVAVWWFGFRQPSSSVPSKAVVDAPNLPQAKSSQDFVDRVGGVRQAAKDDQKVEQTTPQEPPPVDLLPPVVRTSPSDRLVLVGLMDPTGAAEPWFISAAWLWDSRFVVVDARATAILKGMIAKFRGAEKERVFCAISGGSPHRATPRAGNDAWSVWELERGVPLVDAPAKEELFSRASIARMREKSVAIEYHSYRRWGDETDEVWSIAAYGSVELKQMKTSISPKLDSTSMWLEWKNIPEVPAPWGLVADSAGRPLAAVGVDGTLTAVDALAQLVEQVRR